MLVGQGWVSPADFWRLRPVEAWWVVASKIPEQAVQSVATTDRLKKLYYDMKAKEAAQNG